MKTLSITQLIFALSTALLLVACGGGGGVSGGAPVSNTPPSEPEPVMVQFEIQLTNLTAGQPLSPIALVGHAPAYELFQLGQPASAGLEQLAEGGDNSELISEAEANVDVVATTSGDGPLPPGATQLMMLSVDESEAIDLQLSIVSMLVNTNDAVTAVRNLDVSSLEPGMSMNVRTISYDSGTEANTELSGTIPGPVDGGEGFNAARDDIADAITSHSGVVTSDDGLSGSVLNQVHRWDNPVAAITVTRTL